jgi:hypothetical protein
VSANMNTSESTQSGKSLINTTNKIGPRHWALRKFFDLRSKF